VKWTWLSILLVVDGLIASLFGVSTLLFPMAIYSTAVDLRGIAGNGDTLIEAALLNVSAAYVFTGAICFCAAAIPARHGTRIAVVMLLRHAFLAFKGYREANQAWVVGNPWHDVIIHAAFAVAYVVCARLALNVVAAEAPSPAR